MPDGEDVLVALRPATRRPPRPGRTGATGTCWPPACAASPASSASSRRPRRWRRSAGSVADWPAFPDSAAALARLKTRFRLGVITNCDDDLFAASNERLGVDFDWIVTAQQVGSYKPDERNFHLAFERIGLPRERILHVAQSLFHDHVPAQRLGLTSVWIDRRHDRPGSGATPGARGQAGRDVPGHGVVRRGRRTGLIGRGAACRARRAACPPERRRDLGQAALPPLTTTTTRAR